jgi:Fic family protein
MKGNKKMRITIDNEKALILSSTLDVLFDNSEFCKMFNFDDDGASLEILQELSDTIKKEYKKPIKTTKRNATKKAIIVKQERAKKQVQDAINLLRMENKEPTAYAVAKVADISYSTASKYLKLIK